MSLKKSVIISDIWQPDNTSEKELSICYNSLLQVFICIIFNQTLNYGTNSDTFRLHFNIMTASRVIEGTDIP